MNKTRVYDLPIRLFHWIFAGTFLAAFLIAKNVDDESTLFVYHMLLGFILALTVVLRLLWGFVGSRFARFSSFELAPEKLVRYVKQVSVGRTERFPGHNPASSWAALVMMFFGLGLALTGIMMAQHWYKGFAEEVHEFFANSFLIVAILHVAGVVLHCLRHRDHLGLSMMNGMKQGFEVQGVKRHIIVAFLFILITGIFSYKLNSGFDPASGKLHAFGTSLQLGEKEELDD